MGRPRKYKKRTKSGQIKRSEMDKPDLVKPTSEMMRHKARSGGGEINDPLSYLNLSDIQKQALGKYFALAKSAGFGVKLRISSLNQRISGTNNTSHTDDARDIKAKLQYEEAREALASSGPMLIAVVDMVRDYQGKIDIDESYLKALRAGADNLALHFKLMR